MSQQRDFDEEAARRDYRAPFSNNHPIPTIQKYRQHRDELNNQQKQAEAAQRTEEDDRKTKRAFNSVKTIFKDEDKQHPPGEPYPTANRHAADAGREPTQHDPGIPLVPSGQKQFDDESNPDNGISGKAADSKSRENDSQGGKSATETAASYSDPKQKRKAMKHNKRDDGGREVTDPVTHLPIVIRDSTTKDLKRAPENEPASESNLKTTTGLSCASKSSDLLEDEQDQLQDNYDGMQRVFPPPAYDDTQAELVRTFQLALSVGLGITMVLSTVVVLLLLVVNSNSEKSTPSLYSQAQQPKAIFIPLAITIVTAAGIGIALVTTISGWLGNRVKAIWKDEVWDAARVDEIKMNRTNGRLPESVA